MKFISISKRTPLRVEFRNGLMDQQVAFRQLGISMYWPKAVFLLHMGKVLARSNNRTELWPKLPVFQANTEAISRRRRRNEVKITPDHTLQSTFAWQSHSIYEETELFTLWVAASNICKWSEEDIGKSDIIIFFKIIYTWSYLAAHAMLNREYQHSTSALYAPMLMGRRRDFLSILIQL